MVGKQLVCAAGRVTRGRVILNRSLSLHGRKSTRKQMGVKSFSVRFSSVYRFIFGPTLTNPVILMTSCYMIHIMMEDCCFLNYILLYKEENAEEIKLYEITNRLYV